MEFAGADCVAKLTAALRDGGWSGVASPTMCIAAGEAENARLLHTFFDTFKVKI